MFFGDWDTSSTLHHDDVFVTQIPQGITISESIKRPTDIGPETTTLNVPGQALI
jgi:hypothetical protein